MKGTVIDLNCDVGEGIGNEADLFPYITSCNIACGGHAGDTDSMRTVVRLAKKFNLKVGAHPSYPDKLNFGRTSMELNVEDLGATISAQIASLHGILEKEGMKMHHIKAHGALYNDLAVMRGKAMDFLHIIQKYKGNCHLYVPYGSVIASEARRMGFSYHYEAFGDRRYMEGHKLVPRNSEGAVIESPQQVLQQLLKILKEGRVQTLAGSFISMKATTCCIHGDTPSALQILMYLAKELPKHGIYLKG